MVVLEFLKAIIDNFGSAIVVPFIIFIIALIFRVKPAKAFLSALYALMQKSLSFCFLGLGRGILFVMVLDIGNHFLFPVFRIELDIDMH